MADVSIKKEYLTKEKTEIEISEITDGSPVSKQTCLIFNFKSLSKNDLTLIISSLEKWIIDNYTPEMRARWDEKCGHIAYFDSCYERIEEMLSSILYVIKNRNQKVKGNFNKKAEEKTRQLKEEKEREEKILHQNGGSKPHTCSAGCEPGMCSLIKTVD